MKLKEIINEIAGLSDKEKQNVSYAVNLTYRYIDNELQRIHWGSLKTGFDAEREVNKSIEAAKLKVEDFLKRSQAGQKLSGRYDTLSPFDKIK